MTPPRPCRAGDLLSACSLDIAAFEFLASARMACPSFRVTHQIPAALGTTSRRLALVLFRRAGSPQPHAEFARPGMRSDLGKSRLSGSAASLDATLALCRTAHSFRSGSRRYGGQSSIWTASASTATTAILAVFLFRHGHVCFDREGVRSAFAVPGRSGAVRRAGFKTAAIAGANGCGTAPPLLARRYSRRRRNRIIAALLPRCLLRRRPRAGDPRAGGGRRPNRVAVWNVRQLVAGDLTEWRHIVKVVVDVQLAANDGARGA